MGGIVSVALSLGSPPAAVSGCRILCCPDFPLAFLHASDHLIDCSPYYIKYSVVGMTRLELATPRPPDVCATKLRYIPATFRL